MRRLIRKLRMEKYLNSYLILSLDMISTMAASLLSLVVIRLIFRALPGIVEFSWIWFAASMLASYVFFLLLQLYRSVIRHSTLRDIGKICLMALGKEAVLAALIIILPFVSISDPRLLLLCLLDFCFTIGALVLYRVCMIVAYDVLRNSMKYRKRRYRVLVYGADESSLSIVKNLKNSNSFIVVGLLTYGRRLRGTKVGESSVYFFENKESLLALYDHYDIDGVIFCNDKQAQEEKDRLVRYNSENDIKTYIVPPIEDLALSKEGHQGVIREIKIEDLLGREEIKISMTAIQQNFSGKTVLVTGAAGSIGSELVRQLATFGVKKLVLFDNAETPMHNLRLELENRFPELDFIPVIGDVRQAPRLDFAFRTYRPQVVFHAAAYKHVPLMEENPCEAVLVNVIGSRNVADYCLKYEVEQMVMVSTDKAVNPTNIMGCTKRLAEIYVQSLGQALEHGEVKGKTKFVTTRFGNVLGSNGSVIPRFREQLEKGGPITVTHPEITRFFMTIPEACRLVMEAATMTNGNQIFVFDMGESVKIADLAKRMIELAGLREGVDIKIEYTGLRPGEKIYEEVLSDEENTIKTQHEKIRIACVREYNYNDAVSFVNKLEIQSREVVIPEMVKYMKQIVPEFKSKNSVYEVYDKNPLQPSPERAPSNLPLKGEAY